MVMWIMTPRPGRLGPVAAAGQRNPPRLGLLLCQVEAQKFVASTRPSAREERCACLDWLVLWH